MCFPLVDFITTASALAKFGSERVPHPGQGLVNTHYMAGWKKTKLLCFFLGIFQSQRKKHAAKGTGFQTNCVNTHHLVSSQFLSRLKHSPKVYCKKDNKDDDKFHRRAQGSFHIGRIRNSILLYYS